MNAVADAMVVRPGADEITSLNLADLDIDELEHRLAAASMWSEDGWGCGCDGCDKLSSCTNYCNDKDEEAA